VRSELRLLADHLGTGERRLALGNDALVHLRHELVRRLPRLALGGPYDRVRPQPEERMPSRGRAGASQPLQEGADVVHRLDPRQVTRRLPGP
jgi:hypothetical protein